MTDLLFTLVLAVAVVLVAMRYEAKITALSERLDALEKRLPPS